MSHFVSRSISFGVALCISTACTQGPTSPASAAQPATPVGGNPCDRKLLSVDDVAGILSEPITGTKPLAGDPQTCYFITATTESAGGPEIRISLRPGVGRGTLQAWQDGRMGITATPVSGVGDAALWVAETKELVARKNDLLCNVGMGGSAHITHQDDLQSKLEALCNKLFARSGS